MAEIKHSDPEKRFRRVMSASSLSGDTVRNSAGEDLGNVKEIMIDVPSGRVAYAVLSFGRSAAGGSSDVFKRNETSSACSTALKAPQPAPARNSIAAASMPRCHRSAAACF
jgi:sporulation protein YlmC with PRC-barrel domain